MRYRRVLLPAGYRTFADTLEKPRNAGIDWISTTKFLISSDDATVFTGCRY
jgi:hypothetical protein